jgi:hypothetical protein
MIVVRSPHGKKITEVWLYGYCLMTLDGISKIDTMERFFNGLLTLSSLERVRFQDCTIEALIGRIKSYPGVRPFWMALLLHFDSKKVSFLDKNGKPTANEADVSVSDDGEDESGSSGEDDDEVDFQTAYNHAMCDVSSLLSCEVIGLTLGYYQNGDDSDGSDEEHQTTNWLSYLKERVDSAEEVRKVLHSAIHLN